MASIELERKLQKFSNNLIQEHGRNNKLPATIIGAQFRGIKKVGRSGPIPNPIADYLKSELETKLGRLGSVGFKYRIGCCCEVHSSNQIFLTPRIITSTKNIIFTEARRPRTNQVINRCENCRIIFG